MAWTINKYIFKELCAEVIPYHYRRVRNKENHMPNSSFPEISVFDFESATTSLNFPMVGLMARTSSSANC